jgi:LacI family transcriptional regulator
MSITAKELAKKLNISAAAVSMALNNKPGVSNATRRKVLDVAEQHGFDFSKLADKHTLEGSIYFVLYKKHGAVVADTPFFSSLSDGISVECAHQNYKLKISYVFEDDDTIHRQIEDIQFSDCIGIILLGTEMVPENLKLFLDLPVPVVLLDANFDLSACNSVVINNIQGAYLATSYLIREQKQQPGYLKSSYPISNFAERADGFYKAIRQAGMPTRQSIVHQLSPSLEGAYSDMLEILKNNEEIATCYFADNDLIAVGAMKAFKEMGIDIPKDVGIVGFDNIPISSVVDPGLSTIDVPKQYFGRVAVQRLVQILHEPGLPPTITQISTTLIQRNSVSRL